MELEEIRRRLADRRLYVVAGAIGISYQALKNIFDGKTRKPTADTIRKLKDYLNETR